jgi:type I restriction-modification system DNA methylase subunit
MDSNAWHSFIKSCLDILRNGKSKFDGLKVINEFVNLITLKLVENRISDEIQYNGIESESDTNIRIGNDCKITYLYDNYCKPKHIGKSDKCNELFELLYDKNRIWNIEPIYDDTDKFIGHQMIRNTKKECIIVRFNKHTESLHCITGNSVDTKTLTCFELKHAEDVQLLIKKIHETFIEIDFSEFNYDAFGEGYEKMMADELGNSSKRYGQYFTRRDLIDLVLDELDIKPTDKCYDPAVGTGGFILGFSKKCKDTEFIKNNIYGGEVLEDVYMTMAFNMLSYNLDKCIKNINLGSSLDTERHNKLINTIDKVGANPPYGMSIKCNIKEFPVKVLDSTALFLQHIFYVLKVGGKAGVVIDRGILNNGTDKKNSWEGRLRKFLLENTKITKIINLPTGIFKHTNFATSVIFFTKCEPVKSGKYNTDNIEYIEGYFKDEDKGNGNKKMYLKDAKILTMGIIKSKNHSLKFDDFFKVVEVKQNTKGWIKLGEIIESDNAGEVIDKSYFNKGDKILYSCSNDVMKTNFNDFPEKKLTQIGDLLLPRNGSQIPFVKIPESDTLYTNVVSRIKINKTYNYKFISYYLNISIKSFMIGDEANSIPSYNLTRWKDRLIPNLTPQHQQEIVEFLDEIYKTNSINDTVKYMKDYPIFNLLIDKNYSGFKQVIWFQENIPRLMAEMENIPKKKNYYIQAMFNTVMAKGGEMKRLGDIVELKCGKSISKANLIEEGFPYFGANGIIGYTDTYLFDGNYILIARNGTIGAVHIYDGKFYPSDHTFTLKPNECNINYLYLYLKNVVIWKDLAVHNGMPGITRPILENIQIPIPPLEIQQEIINKIKALDDHTSHYSTYAKTLEQELSNIMETIQNMTVKPEIEQPDIKPEDIAEIETKSVDTQPKQINVKPKTKAKTGKTKKQNITIDSTF